MATSSADLIAPLEGKKRKAEADEATQPPPKQAKTRTASTASGYRNSNVEAEADTIFAGGYDGPSDIKLPRSGGKPLFNLREIIADMLEQSQKDGLGHYVQGGRQYFIRVGTLCSGTDAPIHVMDLFGMLKNDQGNQVFTTINSFGCEIEPFKQGFLMRNSKPQLLFRDARDFAKEGATRA